jgi:hypothetical protein
MREFHFFKSFNKSDLMLKILLKVRILRHKLANNNRLNFKYTINRLHYKLKKIYNLIVILSKI